MDKLTRKSIIDGIDEEKQLFKDENMAIVKAVALDMFRCTFDSRTWNQPGVSQGYGI